MSLSHRSYVTNFQKICKIILNNILERTACIEYKLYPSRNPNPEQTFQGNRTTNGRTTRPECPERPRKRTQNVDDEEQEENIQTYLPNLSRNG